MVEVVAEVVVVVSVGLVEVVTAVVVLFSVGLVEVVTAVVVLFSVGLVDVVTAVVVLFSVGLVEVETLLVLVEGEIEEEVIPSGLIMVFEFEVARYDSTVPPKVKFSAVVSDPVPPPVWVLLDPIGSRGP